MRLKRHGPLIGTGFFDLRLEKSFENLENFEISSNYRLNPEEADSKEELELVCDVLKSSCSKDRVGDL